MNLHNVFRSRKSRTANSVKVRAKRRRLLDLENLECRHLMAVTAGIIVNDPSDALGEAPAVGTLRWAVNEANNNPGPDTIQFSFEGPTTIQLVNTLFTFGSVEFVGQGPSQVTIDGGNEVRLFELFNDATEEGSQVAFRGLTLSNGSASGFEANGGAIASRTSDLALRIENVVFDSNSAELGGAIYLDNPDELEFVPLTIINSRFSNNQASLGGAIYNSFGHVEVSGSSTFENNSASTDGGAVYTIGRGESFANTTLIVTGSTFTGNRALEGAGGAVYARNDHVEFTNSVVSSNQAATNGGAIFTVNDTSFNIGTVRLVNSTVSGNSAGLGGGAVYSLGDTISVQSSRILNNSAQEGGAFYLGTGESISSSLQAVNSVLEGNQAVGLVGADGRGGAVFIAPGNNAFINSSQLRNNQARGGDGFGELSTGGTGYGGAIYVAGGLTLSFSSVTGNTAAGGSGDLGGAAIGGGIAAFSFSGVSVSTSTINDNSATGGQGVLEGGDASGGGFYGQLANVELPGQTFISASLFHNNEAVAGAGPVAVGNGGGIWVADSVAISNVTVTGNQADNDGGGIYVGTGIANSVEVLFGTVVNNIADADGNESGTGAGIYFESEFVPTVTNSIVSLNQTLGQDDNLARSLDASFSIGNLINDDPLIGPLADNGGPTRTHALLPGSPAIGNAVDFEFALDQRQIERLFDFDSGAYEVAFDYGDAFVNEEVNYPTTGPGAARHLISSLFFTSIDGGIDAPVDADADGGVAPGASGDDNSDGNDDERGVRFATAASGFLARVDVASSGSGFLNAWIDFNGDRDWDDAGEQIFSAQPVVAGINALTFSVPNLDGPLPEAFARFRLSTSANLGPGGDAPDGEVEDYRLGVQTVILPGVGPTGTFTFQDTVIARQRRTYDPLVATGYVYEVTSGPSFADVEVFAGFGDSVYTLEVENPASPGTYQFVATLHGGDVFDFETLDQSLQDAGGGVRNFRIIGIEVEAGLDPTNTAAFPTGISFVADGAVEFTQTPITEFVNAVATITGDLTGSVVEDGVTDASGTVQVIDADLGEDVFQEPAPASLNGVYGFFTFNAVTGGWTYLLNNEDSDTNALAQDEIVTESLVITSLDGTAQREIVITITGTNDLAEITGTSEGQVGEDSAADNVSGDLEIADVDSPLNFRDPETLVGVYGLFTFNSSTGSWTYTLDNSDPDTNALAAGQVVEDILDVQSSDGSATKQIVITVNGSNDAATITGTATGSVTEDGVGLASGQLTVNDVDSPQTFTLPSSLLGTYGVFTFVASTGAWTYELNNSLAVTNALAAGQVVHDQLVVSSSDETATATLDITITGSNDAATITGSFVGALIEDAAVTTASGDLDVSDPDSPTTFQTPASLVGTYGNFTFNPATGQWTYVLDNADPDTNALNNGQVVHDTLTVKSQDGTATQVIDITITGATDVATNTPPTANLTAPARGVRGQRLSFTLKATDSPADQAAGFTYKVVWGDGTPDTIVPATPGNGAGVTVTRVFARSGSFNVSLVATDQAGATSVAAVRTVAVSSAAIQATPAGSILVIGGTTSSDRIKVERSLSTIDVYINNVRTRFSTAVSSIQIYAQAGNDTVIVSPFITAPTYIEGGDGNDSLYAGSGRSILSGGAGDDLLFGGLSRDLLIGGTGKDRLFGSAGGDIIIGARTTHENNVDTLFTILTKWNANLSYTNRINSLASELNTTTVLNDSAEDLLGGSLGTDWFFARRTGAARDQVFAAFGERITEI